MYYFIEEKIKKAVDNGESKKTFRLKIYTLAQPKVMFRQIIKNGWNFMS